MDIDMGQVPKFIIFIAMLALIYGLILLAMRKSAKKIQGGIADTQCRTATPSEQSAKKIQEDIADTQCRTATPSEQSANKIQGDIADTQCCTATPSEQSANKIQGDIARTLKDHVKSILYLLVVLVLGGAVRAAVDTIEISIDPKIMAMIYILVALAIIYAIVRFVQEKLTKKNPENIADTPTGIGGWLLVFIVLATLGTCLGAIQEIRDIIDLYAEYPALANSLKLYAAVYAFYAAFWLYAIYLLITVHRSALKMIRAVLIMNPVFVCLAPCILFICIGLFTGFAHMPVQVDFMPLYSGITVDLFLAAIPSALWLTYFHKSVRVKNTWAHHAPHDQMKTIGIIA